jgi:signal transduction histidine kinase
MSKKQMNVPKVGKKRENQRGANILVVDDMTVNLRLLVSILKKHGYQVRPARNGPLALSSARRAPPDLILLDIMMPRMDGYEVCRQLKADERTRDIPVIFISALNEVLDKVKAFSVGGVDYMTKPFQIEEVLARVERHLVLRNLQMTLQMKNDQLQEEIIRRKQAEQLLVEYNRTLEQKVEERTAELAEATRQAQEARVAAEAASRAKSAFLANVSHELRTPLNAILGFSQLMDRSPTLSREEQENIGIINGSGEHLLALINNILHFSKIEAGRLALHKSNFDLYRLLDELEEMFHLKANEKHLQLSFERDSDLPRYVQTDRAKLRQVLINLVDNAIKFTKQGKVSLHVRQVDSTLLHFEVQDSGVGIAPSKVNKLFGAFVQGHQGMKKEDGTGLGLPISRQFVRLMGGEMSISSSPSLPFKGGQSEGRGTLVKFDLPISVAKGSDKPKSRRVVALEPNQARYRILIVDDKWTNRQLLIKRLKPLGFCLKEASNGQEATLVWEQYSPHLIFLDMRMPVMNGYEATKRIKATTKGQATAIIALTTSILGEERGVVLSAGCDDFLPKPFSEADIFDIISKHLGVRYIYEDDPPEESPTQVEAEVEVLTAAALSALPPDWLASFHQAIFEFDLGLMLTLIDQLHNKPLANALAELTNNFEYEVILTLLQQAEEMR